MASGEEYRLQIGKFKSHKALLKLWQQISSKYTPGWESGKALEYLILRAFEIEKADVCWPFEVRLDGTTVEQIDGVVYAAELDCIVEAKDWTKSTAIEPIAKLRNQLLRRPAGVIGSVFTTSPFSPAARTLARYLSPQTVLLWSREDIEFALSRRGMVGSLRRKYRYAVEQGLPDLPLQESE